MGSTCTHITNIYSNNNQNRFENIYKLGKNIGIGSFGVVKKCRHKKTGEFYAVKIISRHHFSLAKMPIEQYLSEISILTELDHPYVIKLIDFFDEKPFSFVVMELCSGGELFHQIVKRKKFTEEDASQLCAQMISSLEYLHSKSIIHRDIKAENFLFKENDIHSNLKLIDFGMATKLPHNLFLSNVCGSPHYVSPELLNKEYNHSSDMWAFGVLLYLMLFGKYPFEGVKQFEIKKEIMEKNINWSDEECKHLSSDVKEFLSLLLERDISKRLTAKDALKHPWIISHSTVKKNYIIQKKNLKDARRLSMEIPN